jgi:hypothetical protein
VDDLQAAFEAPEDKVAERVVFAGICSLSVSTDWQRGRSTCVQELATSHHCLSRSFGAGWPASRSDIHATASRALFIAIVPCPTSGKRIRLTKLPLAHNRF